MSFRDAYHHDNFTALTLKTSGGTEDFVAGLQGLTITPQFEYEDLYTADSILREAVRRYEASVQVDISYSLFNVELVRHNMGSPGSAGSTITDDGEVPLFELDFEADSSGGDRTLGTITVENMRFDDDPPIWDGSHGEWVEWSGTMIGKNVTGVSVTDNTV